MVHKPRTNIRKRILVLVCWCFLALVLGFATDYGNTPLVAAIPAAGIGWASRRMLAGALAGLVVGLCGAAGYMLQVLLEETHLLLVGVIIACSGGIAGTIVGALAGLAGDLLRKNATEEQSPAVQPKS